MPPRHLYSLSLPGWAGRGRVCRLWNVFTAQNALVCRVDGGMLAACDLTPAGASTIFTCDMRLTAVSSRAPTQILHTSLVRGKQWLVQLFILSSLLYSFAKSPLIDISFSSSHSLQTLSPTRQAHLTHKMFSIRLPNALALYMLLLAIPLALCHVQMTWPAPLRSKYNPSTPENLIDYSISSPLSASGSNFPCKRYQNDPDQLPTARYTAGSTYNVTLAGEATHGGGSCQLSLSYDKGQTFRVIKSMIGGCPKTLTYDFTVPSYAPSGEALFAWTWQNKIGNREFYMDCAVVEIESPNGGQQRRQDPIDSIDNLPGIWKADLQSVNDCATVEGENPVYPHPGSDVVYGDGMDSSSSATEGNCDATSPSSANAGSSSTDPYTSYAPVDGYVQGGGGPDNSSSSSDNGMYDINLHQKAPVSATTPDYAVNSPGQLKVAPSQEDSSAPITTSPADLSRYATDAASTRSTTTVFIDCPDTVTMTIYPTETPPVSSSPPTYTTSILPSACTGTSATCPCAAGYDCRLIGTCTWACIAQGQTSSSGFRTTTATSRPSSSSARVSVVTSASATRPSAPPDYSSPPPQTPSRPPYADAAEIQTYLPCVPGTFICSSSTEWYTCDYNGATDSSRPSTAWVYTSPRKVAAGMECLPFLSPYSASSEQYAQQNKAPQGYYHDDRYVRERPDGDCDTDGSLMCTDGGQSYSVCDHGGWVRMGSVADGTVCRNGAIVGA